MADKPKILTHPLARYPMVAVRVEDVWKQSYMSIGILLDDGTVAWEGITPPLNAPELRFADGKWTIVDKSLAPQLGGKPPDNSPMLGGDRRIIPSARNP